MFLHICTKQENVTTATDWLPADEHSALTAAIIRHCDILFLTKKGKGAHKQLPKLLHLRALSLASLEQNTGHTINSKTDQPTDSISHRLLTPYPIMVIVMLGIRCTLFKQCSTKLLTRLHRNYS